MGCCVFADVDWEGGGKLQKGEEELREKLQEEKEELWKRERELQKRLLEFEVLRKGGGLLELEVSKRYNINNISN